MTRYVCVVLILGAAVLSPIGIVAQTEKESARLERRSQIRQCRALLKESLRAIDGGEYDSALVSLGEALKCDPKNPNVFYHTARVLLIENDTTGATDTLAAGIRKAPLSSRLKLLQARLKVARSELTEAGELIDGVLAIKPNEGEALYLKGLVSLEQGDSTGAVTAWRQALDVSLAKHAP